MAIAAVQLSSFYSYRYFVPPFKGSEQPPTDAVEQQVRAKVSEGDAAFALRKYTEALNALSGSLRSVPQVPASAISR